MRMSLGSWEAVRSQPAACPPGRAQNPAWQSTAYGEQSWPWMRSAQVAPAWASRVKTNSLKAKLYCSCFRKHHWPRSLQNTICVNNLLKCPSLLNAGALAPTPANSLPLHHILLAHLPGCTKAIPNSQAAWLPSNVTTQKSQRHRKHSQDNAAIPANAPHHCLQRYFPPLQELYLWLKMKSCYCKNKPSNYPVNPFPISHSFPSRCLRSRQTRSWHAWWMGNRMYIFWSAVRTEGE